MDAKNVRCLSCPGAQGAGPDPGRAGRTAACDRQGRQPLGTRRRSAGHQYAGTSGRRTGPVSCGPDALPRPGTGAANCASPTGRFLFHVAPPPCGGLAFCPHCAAPAKYRPGTVGAYSPATEHLQFTGVPSAMVLYKPMAGCPRGSIFPLLAGMEFLMLELWNSFEQSGFYHRYLEACTLLDTPFLRLTRVILELLFFFGFGFLVPCAEITIMLFN